jgi:hypothetical protein
MFESKINRGRANGYAPLDGSGKVPLDKLPPIQSTINTGSFATTGSNTFTGEQTISTIQGTGSLYLKPDLEDSRYFEIYNTNPNDTHIKANGGLSYFGDDTNYLKIDDSAGDVTIAAFSDIILTSDDGGVYIGSYGSGNGVVTNGYLNTIIGDTDIINGSTGNSITDVIGRISVIDSSSLATTGSNVFRGNQSISGSVNISSSLVVSSTIINNGNIEALNSDLIIDGGDIVLSGSFAQQVNYAPFGSGSWETQAIGEVTELDITKDIHLLDTSGDNGLYNWYLPDGLYDGQVVRFALKGDNDTSPNNVKIWMNNLRNFKGITVSSFPWHPFYDDTYGSPRSLATALYIDGAWNIDTDYWDM